MERESKYRMVANRMIKGCNAPVLTNNVAAEEQTIKEFEEKYYDVIDYLVKIMPSKLSSGILGALGKAILWYGEDKIKPLCERIAKKDFQGINDPVFALYEWLIKQSKGKTNTKEAYRITVTIVRAYLRGGGFSTKNHLRPAGSDIFEWADNYNTMVADKKGQWDDGQKKKSVFSEEDMDEYLDVLEARHLD